jgi:hypothetical protein
MFEDEMTEENLATTAADYYRVTECERHEESLARAKAYIAALEAKIHAMEYHKRAADNAFPLLFRGSAA